MSANRTNSIYFKPPCDTFSVKNMRRIRAWKFNDFLLFLKLRLANNASIFNKVFFVILHLWYFFYRRLIIIKSK